MGAHRVEHVAVLAEQRDDVGAGRELLERAVVGRKQRELSRGVRELVDELGRNNELGEGQEVGVACGRHGHGLAARNSRCTLQVPP